MKNQKAQNILKKISGISLILFPLILMVAFGMHYDNLSDFFTFKLRYEPNSVQGLMSTLTGPNRDRLFTNPHMLAYFSVPFLMISGMYMGYVLFKQKPWYAIIGVLNTLVGGVYLGGVFAAWLSFAAVGNLAPDQIAGAIPALEALTEMQGPLALTTYLSALSLIGLMVLAVGLYASQIVPKWAASLIFTGNLLIMVFIDLDNWMFIGALMNLIGTLPLSLPLLFKNQPAASQLHFTQESAQELT
ncbi:MAG: hypothetical protein FVQ83_11355 [Chloroflexi bacterium]|nr:hypothetical protein [Chloroflexota bacterium]